MIKDILPFYLKPKELPDKINQIDISSKDLFIKVVIPFALIPVIGYLIGFTILKGLYISSIDNFLKEYTTNKELQDTVRYMKALKNILVENNYSKIFIMLGITWIFEIIRPIILYSIVYFFAGSFGGDKDINKAFKVSVFSLIPMWIAGIFYMINSPITMIVMFLATFYAFYIIFLSSDKILNIPTENSKNFQFIIVLIIFYLIISGLIGMFETKLIKSLVLGI